MLCILFARFGSGPKFQRCRPLGTKAPGLAVCHDGAKTIWRAKKLFFCGMVQDGSALPTHAAIATHTTARVGGTQAESKLGRAALAESKVHDEVLHLGFWK